MKYTNHDLKVSTERLQESLDIMNRMDAINKALRDELEEVKKNAQLL